MKSIFWKCYQTEEIQQDSATEVLILILTSLG